MRAPLFTGACDDEDPSIDPAACDVKRDGVDLPGQGMLVGGEAPGRVASAWS